jgi:hypothetical protein
MGRGGSDDESFPEKCGAHCYEGRKVYTSCCCVGLLVMIILLSMSWDVISPTQYGLLKNGVTGTVDLGTIWYNGRHMVGPSAHFVKFPSTLQTLSYGDRNHDQQIAIPARTGADEGTVSSGGQPVTLEISFQYKLDPERLPSLYLTFGEDWEKTFLRFAQQAVTNVAQNFIPSEFWTSRAAIESAVHAAVNHTIYVHGYATVPSLQLRSVNFQSSYEQTITDIQLQEQLKVTKTYQLEVTKVIKEVDLMQAETNREIIGINADATRQQDVLVGQANAAALMREQTAKATMFAQLVARLGWTTQDFLQYVKMRALNAQPTSNVVVGVNAVGTVPPS